MNKKLFALLLCLCLALSLTACQQPSAPAAAPTAAPTDAAAPEVTDVPADAAAPEATDVPADEAAPEVTAVPADAAAPEATDAPVILEPTFADTDVLLTLNGEPVTWAVAKPYYENFAAQYGVYYDMSQQENLDTFLAVAAENALHETLLMQKATELGLAPLTEEEQATALTEADAIWEENIQYYVSSSHPELTAESAEADVQAARDEAIAYLNEAGYTQEFIRSSYSQSVVLDRLYEQLVQDVAITDADVEAEYQAQVAADKALYENDLNAYVAYNNNVEMNNMYMMYTGQGVQMDYAWYRPAGFRGVKHILLSVDETLMQEYNSIQAALEEQMTAETAETEAAEPAATQVDLDNAKAAILAAAQEKIDEINQRLANGEDFEALIPEYTADSDNLYEVCIASSNYVPEFVEAAFSVDHVGDVSAPYISQFGIHIVKYMEDIPAGPIEMTEEQRQLKYEQLLTSRQEDAYAAKVDEWKAASTVEYTGLVQSYEELLQSLIAEEEAAVTEDTPAEEAVAETPIEVTEAPAAE